MSSATVKDRAHELLDNMPDGATWDDVVYEMVTRREIERGLVDSEAGRTTSVEDVVKEFGIAE